MSYENPKKRKVLIINDLHKIVTKMLKFCYKNVKFLLNRQIPVAYIEIFVICVIYLYYNRKVCQNPAHATGRVCGRVHPIRQTAF